jgi:hypothetical protein
VGETFWFNLLEQKVLSSLLERERILKGYLLIEVKEEGCEFLCSLEHLEVGGRLVPRAVQGEGVNNGVSAVGLS